VSNGELIFVVDSSGTLTCYDAKDGKKQWQQDLNDECAASPSIANGRLYLITKKARSSWSNSRASSRNWPAHRSAKPSRQPGLRTKQDLRTRMKHLICLEAKGAAARNHSAQEACSG